jgi:hypothetical protein
MTLKRTGQPFEPTPYDNSIIAATRAVAGGTANEGQQKLFWKWLIEVSGYYDLSFRPGGDDGRRLSDFAEGKRFVGSQCLKMLQPVLTPSAPPKEEQPKRIVRGKTKDKT